MLLLLCFNTFRVLSVLDVFERGDLENQSQKVYPMNTIVAMKAALANGSIHQGPFIFYGVGGEGGGFWEGPSENSRAKRGEHPKY